MNIRKQRKRKLSFVVRSSRYVEGQRRPRKHAIYYQDYCCRMCYFDWGRGFEVRHQYKHNSAESNYDGILKKYWTSPEYGWVDEDVYPPINEIRKTNQNIEID